MKFKVNRENLRREVIDPIMWKLGRGETESSIYESMPLQIKLEGQLMEEYHCVGCPVHFPDGTKRPKNIEFGPEEIEGKIIYNVENDMISFEGINSGQFLKIYQDRINKARKMGRKSVLENLSNALERFSR